MKERLESETSSRLLTEKELVEAKKAWITQWDGLQHELTEWQSMAKSCQAPAEQLLCDIDHVSELLAEIRPKANNAFQRILGPKAVGYQHNMEPDHFINPKKELERCSSLLGS